MTEVFWQCPKCRHRVNEEEDVCQKCGRASDGREATFIVPRARQKSLPELELELQEAHAEATKDATVPASQPPAEDGENLVFHVPHGWKGWVIAGVVVAAAVAVTVAAALVAP